MPSQTTAYCYCRRTKAEHHKKGSAGRAGATVGKGLGENEIFRTPKKWPKVARRGCRMGVGHPDAVTASQWVPLWPEAGRLRGAAHFEILPVAAAGGGGD